jgi:hypothetical protein
MARERVQLGAPGACNRFAYQIAKRCLIKIRRPLESNAPFTNLGFWKPALVSLSDIALRVRSANVKCHLGLFASQQNPANVPFPATCVFVVDGSVSNHPRAHDALQLWSQRSNNAINLRYFRASRFIERADVVFR